MIVRSISLVSLYFSAFLVLSIDKNDIVSTIGDRQVWWQTESQSGMIDRQI